MWIVRLALRRPYTLVAAALVQLLLTPFVLLRTPMDIFPSVNIPVVSVIWQYAGRSAQEIEQRIVYVHELAITVPILQNSLTSPNLSEQEIYDLGQNQVRIGLATIQDVQISRTTRPFVSVRRKSRPAWRNVSSS